VSDVRGRLIGANRAGLRLFGLRSTEELGTDVRELFDRLPATHADGRKLAPDELPIARGLAGQRVQASDLVVLHQQGERPCQLSLSSSPIRDDDGNVMGVVAVIRDVTELVELDHLKDQFIRAAAHELKTPVTIMKARAQGLLRGGAEPDPRRRQMLESIDRGADRIADIVHDLLELSEVQLGRLSISPDRVDLRAVVEDVVARATRRSIGERIHLHADDGAIVEGDRTRLAGVIGRLLQNAAKYSPNGGEIDVDLHVEDGRAVVSVTDHGIGIPRDKQARLFECFYRAHAATQEDFGGLGIGLFLARKIIDLHRGSIWFKSEQGHGSTFAFSLPLHGGPLAADA
jgi:PAS domain S-box-containing protein